MHDSGCLAVSQWLRAKHFTVASKVVVGKKENTIMSCHYLVKRLRFRAGGE